MKSFFNLVAFEYKKILRRKSTKVTLVVVLLMTVLGCVGTLMGRHYISENLYENNYEAMQKDRRYARALSGREINQALLLEAAREGHKAISDEDMSMEDYEKYVRPYGDLNYIAHRVYGKPLREISEEETKGYYELRDEHVKGEIASIKLNDHSKEKLLDLEGQVKKPFVYEYMGGYERFIVMMYATGIMASLAAAIYCAPIFAGEYTDGTEQLILSSKYGRKKLIFAKVFTGITLTLLNCLLVVIVTYFECMFIWGFDGKDAMWQLRIPLSSYPLTMGQVALALVICVLCANVFSTAIVMGLSAKVKTSFSVIILAIIMIILPMFVKISMNSPHAYKIFNLFPSKMMEERQIVSSLLYEVGQLSILPYIFMPMFALIGTGVMVPFIYFSARRHEIN